MDGVALEKFLRLDSDGECYGGGNGLGEGYGEGYGYGSACGSGTGHGCGSGYGYGNGNGTGYSSGYGYGYGCGDGSDDGTGHGCGSGYGIKRINGYNVNMIDGIQTIITSLRSDIAKGYILRADLSFEPCFVVKRDGLFAHGETLRKAMDALRDKMFEDMPEEERIEAFVRDHEWGKAYPNADYFDWHHRLTGSCEMGRKEFVLRHEIDMNGSMTVEEFIALTEHDYGGDVIKRLRKAYTMEDDV